MEKSFFEKLLDFYQINEDKYRYINREIDISSFINAHNFNKIDEAVELVKKHVKNNSKIIIYGDYDADGICSTSIISKMLLYENFKADYFIPSRYLDGYGINNEQAKDIINKGYNLVICVDNGVSAFEPIKLLKDNNIDVLVLDHHEILDEVPNANVILHPMYSKYGDVATSAGFVSFIFSIHYLNRFDKYLSILASISLISDMMPLLDYNRDLLRYVLANYKVGEFLPIDLLNNNEKLSEENIGLGIAPKINAIGRVLEERKAKEVVEFLISEDKEHQLNYISFINEINEQRKELSKEYSDQIDFKGNKCICEITDAKEGLLGLIANKLMNKYMIPCLIVSLDKEKGIYKGSARAPEGFNIVDCFSHLNKYFEAFGGHAQAGGCSIKVENFDKFKKEFEKYCEKHEFTPKKKDTIDISLKDITHENYDILKSFGPFGEAWKSPPFKISNIRTNALTYSRDLNHIMTNISLSSKIVGFYMPKSKIEPLNRIDIIGNMKISIFKGKSSLDFQIQEYSVSKN